VIQEIVTDYPPLYDDIAMAFNLHPNDSVIFSWGDRIYNPMGVDLGLELIAHEAVHGERQSSNPDKIRDWWMNYMSRATFRLAEEVLAHRAEYDWLRINGNRKQRRSALPHVANKLAAPLYGGLIDLSGAKAMLRTH